MRILTPRLSLQMCEREAPSQEKQPNQLTRRAGQSLATAIRGGVGAGRSGPAPGSLPRLRSHGRTHAGMHARTPGAVPVAVRRRTRAARFSEASGRWA